MSLYDVAVTSHELHGVWTYRHFDYLFNNFFSLTTKISKSNITSGFPSQRASKAGGQGASDSWYHMRELTETLCSESTGWQKAIWTISHPDDLVGGSISPGGLMDKSGWCHPGDIWKFPKSPGWHNAIWSLSHPDELAPGRISSGSLKDTVVCHPDDLRYCPMSSGWHNIIWTPPLLSHPDDIAKFEVIWMTSFKVRSHLDDFCPI